MHSVTMNQIFKLQIMTEGFLKMSEFLLLLLLRDIGHFYWIRFNWQFFSVLGGDWEICKNLQVIYRY